MSMIIALPTPHVPMRNSDVIAIVALRPKSGTSTPICANSFANHPNSPFR